MSESEAEEAESDESNEEISEADEREEREDNRAQNHGITYRTLINVRFTSESRDLSACFSVFFCF